MSFVTSLRAPSLRVTALAAACGASWLAAVGCTVGTSRAFTDGNVGVGSQMSSGGAGTAGSGNGGGSAGSSGNGGSAGTVIGTTTSTGSGTTTTTTTTTTTGPGEVCGNGVCNAAAGENTQSCPQDCPPPGMCAHGVCDFG